MKSLLNMFSKQDIEVLVNVVKERLQNHGYAKSLKGVRQSVSRRAFLHNGYTLHFKYQMEEGNFICDRPDLRNHVHRVFPSNKFWPGKKTQTSVV